MLISKAVRQPCVRRKKKNNTLTEPSRKGWRENKVALCSSAAACSAVAAVRPHLPWVDQQWVPLPERITSRLIILIWLPHRLCWQAVAKLPAQPQLRKLHMLLLLLLLLLLLVAVLPRVAPVASLARAESPRI
jgi:hypothetical protein